MRKTNKNSNVAASTNTREVFKLSDECLFQLVKLLQLGMLTGTNIVDHLRQLRLESVDKSRQLVLTPEYKEWFDGQVSILLAQAEELAKQQQSTILQ